MNQQWSPPHNPSRNQPPLSQKNEHCQLLRHYPLSSSTQTCKNKAVVNAKSLHPNFFETVEGLHNASLIVPLNDEEPLPEPPEPIVLVAWMTGQRAPLHHHLIRF
jgi:hypothetical protein